MHISNLLNNPEIYTESLKQHRHEHCFLVQAQPGLHRELARLAAECDAEQRGQKQPVSINTRHNQQITNELLYTHMYIYIYIYIHIHICIYTHIHAQKGAAGPGGGGAAVPVAGGRARAGKQTTSEQSRQQQAVNNRQQHKQIHKKRKGRA